MKITKADIKKLNLEVFNKANYPTYRNIIPPYHIVEEGENGWDKVIYYIEKSIK